MEQQLLFPSLVSELENTWQQKLKQLHIGIDEAGRGCLAGPVVASAVLFPLDFDFSATLPGLDDSKKISEKKRCALAPKIMAECRSFGIGYASAKEIDKINILNATFLAMGRACTALYLRLGKANKEHCAIPLFIDGNKTIPASYWNPMLPLPAQTSVIGGDALFPSISAASVLAKTARDSFMNKLSVRYPQFDFARHKGYGTKKHLEALVTNTPCRLHRVTFAGVLHKNI